MVIPESYLAHGLFGRGEERANHKYVARIPTGKNSYRYFYSAAEYKAYKTGKSVGNRIDKMKGQTSKTIQAYNNKVRAMANKTGSKVGDIVERLDKMVDNTVHAVQRRFDKDPHLVDHNQKLLDENDFRKALFEVQAQYLGRETTKKQNAKIEKEVIERTDKAITKMCIDPSNNDPKEAYNYLATAYNGHTTWTRSEVDEALATMALSINAGDIKMDERTFAKYQKLCKERGIPLHVNASDVAPPPPKEGTQEWFDQTTDKKLSNGHTLTTYPDGHTTEWYVDEDGMTHTVINSGKPTATLQDIRDLTLEDVIGISKEDIPQVKKEMKQALNEIRKIADSKNMSEEDIEAEFAKNGMSHAEYKLMMAFLAGEKFDWRWLLET